MSKKFGFLVHSLTLQALQATLLPIHNHDASPENGGPLQEEGTMTAHVPLKFPYQELAPQASAGYL